MLHRGLTVRPNLDHEVKVSAGLSLAEDLNALKRWDESGEVLDTLLRSATGRSRYWRTRFAQRHGQGNLPEAARTLKHAPRHVPERDREGFRRAYASYQLDRALRHALAGEAGEAKARLRDVKGLDGSESRSALVQAVLAAVANDAAGAVTVQCALGRGSTSIFKREGDGATPVGRHRLLHGAREQLRGRPHRLHRRDFLL